ncbi:MAG: glycosyltransferase family 9 protein [Verrucomicrobiota bacterium]
MDFSAIESVLVVKPSSLGDVVHTLPAVALLRRQFPDLRIGWVVNETWAPVLRGSGVVDGVVEFPRERFRGAGGFLGMWRWIRGLRDLRPDLALDFQGLFRSVWMARASRAGELAGLEDGREGSRWCYDEVVAVPDGAVHSVDRYLALVAAGGVEVPGGKEGLEFPLPEGDEPSDASELPEGYVLFHPVSRGEGKSMPGDQVKRFCEVVGPERVVLVGRQAVSGESGEWDLPPGVVNWMDSTSLGELIWLVRRAGVVVTVDSGPMHLAAAVSERVIGIHTWTDPRKVGPYRPGCLVWKAGQVRPVGALAGDDAALVESRGDRRWVLTVTDVEAIASAAMGVGPTRG